jgi:glutamate 5-kinase
MVKVGPMATDSNNPRAWIDDTRRVVIKIGTRVLVDEHHQLDEARVADLVRQMAELHAGGREVICVSSGAIAAGLRGLDASRRPRDLPSLQAAAAIGQARLIGLYRELFALHGLKSAQLLLTHADMRSRERHLNARNTFHRLLCGGVLPIVNENDSVAVDEIRVGDNDMLSGLVACLVRADLLVMLTNADGLLTRPPDHSERSDLVPTVSQITPEVYAMAGGSSSPVATGGMRSKVQAADMVTRAGEFALIANGLVPDVLERIFAGEPLGTVLEPRQQRLRGRQRWIAFFDHPQGDLHVDAGAARAVRDQGRSLLAVGVQDVDGTFPRGAPVRIIDPHGGEIARGLVNYPADDLRRIQGCRSVQIVEVLGNCEYEEVVHRDNLVVV